MKYAISIMIVCLIATTGFGLSYTGYYSENAPVIDGVLGSGEWDNAMSFGMEYPSILNSPNEGSMPLPPTYPTSFLVPDDNADLSGQVYVKWDSTAVYFAIRVFDQDIQTTGDYGNLQDHVQFLFNPGLYEGHYSAAGYKATLFELDPASATVNSRNNGFNVENAVGYAATILSDGFVIEFSYDWAYCTALGLKAPNPGDTIKVSWILLDWENGGYETFMCDSSGDEGAWAMSTAATWNELLFVAADGCGLNGVNSSDVNYDCSVDMGDFATLASSWLNCTDPQDSDCQQ